MQTLPMSLSYNEIKYIRLMTFSPLATLKIVKILTFGAASDGNFFGITTFLLQFLHNILVISIDVWFFCHHLFSCSVPHCQFSPLHPSDRGFTPDSISKVQASTALNKSHTIVNVRNTSGFHTLKNIKLFFVKE